MLASVCVGTNDLELAGKFYDQLLSCIGMHRSKHNDLEIGYGLAGQNAQFWVLLPFDKNPAAAGNGVQISFAANSRAEVIDFFECAVALGGQCEGEPGLRDYQPGYFAAYCRDLDGNKLHVFTIEEQA